MNVFIRISYLLCFCTVIASCKNSVDVVEESFEDGSPRVIRTYDDYEGEKVLLKEKVNYPNGKIQLTGTYKNDKRDGLWTYYYENGNKWSEAEYTNGEYNGKSTTWFENGKLRYEGYYKNGKKTGKWKFYNEEGKFEKETEF